MFSCQIQLIFYRNDLDQKKKKAQTTILMIMFLTWKKTREPRPSEEKEAYEHPEDEETTT